MSGVRAEAMCVLRGGVFVRERSFHGHIEYNVGLPLGVGVEFRRMLRMCRLFVALRRVGVFIFDLFFYIFGSRARLRDGVFGCGLASGPGVMGRGVDARHR